MDGAERKKMIEVSLVLLARKKSSSTLISVNSANLFCPESKIALSVDRETTQALLFSERRWVILAITQLPTKSISAFKRKAGNYFRG